MLRGQNMDDSVVGTQHERTSTFTRHTTKRLWSSNGDDPAGAPYVAALCAGAGTGSMPAAKPGVHYRIIEPVLQENYIAFPDMLATQGVRHRWILIRQARPTVPMPHHTPLLRKHMSETAKSRILSIYLRPWTLVREHATPRVPHLLDLDVVVTSALVPKRRHTVKKPPSVALERSMVNA